VEDVPPWYHAGLEDRVVEFHSQYGRHHRVRVPKAGSLGVPAAAASGSFGGSPFLFSFSRGFGKEDVWLLCR